MEEPVGEPPTSWEAEPSGGEEAPIAEAARPEVAEPLPRPSDAVRDEPPPIGCPEDEEIARLAAAARLRITVIGCGGAGSNTVHRCVDDGVEGAELCAINTDVAHLLTIRAHRKILLGRRVTGGRGAGARPELGLQAAQESEEEIRQSLVGAHIAFVTAGLGGGTGTGSAPVVARIAKEAGALTMGVVSLPFSGEGIVRREVALEGLERLRRICDTTVIIENDRLLELAPHSSLTAAFKVGDGVLASAIKGVTETLTKPGLVNLDFADLLTVVRHGGVALIGLGESGPGPDRAADAVASALHSPLLGTVELDHATGALVHVVGDPTLTVSEAEKVAALVGSKIAKNARIIWGCSVDGSPDKDGTGIRVLIILTGVRAKSLVGQPSALETLVASPPPAPAADARGALPPRPLLDRDQPPVSAFAYRVRSGFLPAARRIFQRGFGIRRKTEDQ